MIPASSNIFILNQNADFRAPNSGGVLMGASSALS
jgi:hypothetical protein